MKTFSLFAAILALGLAFTAGDADAARRLGGGKSFGMQRQAVEPVRSPTAAPAPAPTTASSAAKSPTTAAAPQTPPKRSWMGPLAGLAAGLGLAALASHLGFGEQFGSILLIGLLVMAAVAIVGALMRRRAAPLQPALATAGGSAYADDRATHRYDSAVPVGGGAVPAPQTGEARAIPADFDVAAFVRNAKVHFIRLQAANDAANLDDIREFTTPEMFAELKMDIAERGGAAQETDVVSIEADVIEVAEEANRYIVSVRFSGLIREDKEAPAAPVDEIWHLVKPRDGSGGWLLAGIQQLQ